MSIPDDLTKGLELKKVRHLIITQSEYGEKGSDEESVTYTDINVSQKISVETAIGILESVKYVLLTGDGNYLAPMGEQDSGEGDTEGG
jgi:hypothetical protein